MRLPRPRRRLRLRAHLRYLGALLRRFRLSLVLAGLLFTVAPALYLLTYEEAGGRRIGFGEALHHVYFLLFGEPSLPYVDSVAVEALNLLIPPLGIALVVDGVVRFAYLYFAKHRSDKEWIAMVAESLSGHVVVCGAGRVGFRVASELLELGRDVLVVEKREDATFVAVLRDLGVPVLIDDIRAPGALKRTHLSTASAIVCATDDDLANVNAALDARRVAPDIRVVVRLFDDDLVAKFRDSFRAEALSTSALAAPAMALCALDPRIVHSFRLGEHLMVVSDFEAGPALSALTLADVRDRFGAITLAVRAGGQPEVLHPTDSRAIRSGDVLTLQADYRSYLALRDFTSERNPPAFLARSPAPAAT